MNATFERGRYGEIKLVDLDEATRKQVRALVNDAGTRPDEHGSWDFSAEFDGKGRGSAINWDLYAVGNDMYDRQFLAIIQVQRYELQHKNWWPTVHKNYFLVGRNEDNTAFAHPIQAQVIHRAIRDDKDVILAVQNWMFGGDYANLIRQGDIALIHVKSVPAPEVDEQAVMVAESHEIVAKKFRRNRHLYALDPVISHPQHPMVSGRGWYRVMESKRADYWRFAPPTKD